jgi:hypothetical protein
LARVVTKAILASKVYKAKLVPKATQDHKESKAFRENLVHKENKAFREKPDCKVMLAQLGNKDHKDHRASKDLPEKLVHKAILVRKEIKDHRANKALKDLLGWEFLQAAQQDKY